MPAKKRKGSLGVFVLSLGGSNASKIEVEAILTPPYNAASFGVFFVYTPHQADVIIVLGSGTAKSLEPGLELLSRLSSTPVIMIGSDTPFAKLYSKIKLNLPVSTTRLLGSPPDPQAILDAILVVTQS